MKDLLKIGVIGGVLALVLVGVSLAKDALSQLTVKVVGYGKPTISNWILHLPIIVHVNNRSDLSVTLNRVVADLYIQKDQAWVAAAHVDQSISVPPGETNQTIYAQGNIANIFGGNIFSTINALSNAYKGKLPIKVEVTVYYAGIALPKQTFNDTISI